MTPPKKTPMVWRLWFALLGLLLFLAMSSCSVNRIALRMTADAMTGVGRSTVFTGDDDPELVGDSLPLLLKMYETLQEQLPDHEGLNLQTGSLTIMYANAFVQTPAEVLPPNQAEKKKDQLERAKKLYLRGERLIIHELELKFPGIKAALAAGSASPLLAKAKKADVPLLYWESAAIMSAFALSPLDIGLSVRVKEAKALMARAYTLDSNFGGTSLDEFYIAFYGSLPESLGGDKALAKRHFDLAVKKGGGKAAGPYVAYVSAISIPNQDYTEFKTLITAALAVNVDDVPANRLVNILAQRKAAWLLAHQDDLFLDIPPQ